MSPFISYRHAAQVVLGYAFELLAPPLSCKYPDFKYATLGLRGQRREAEVGYAAGLSTCYTENKADAR